MREICAGHGNLNTVVLSRVMAGEWFTVTSPSFTALEANIMFPMESGGEERYLSVNPKAEMRIIAWRSGRSSEKCPSASVTVPVINVESLGVRSATVANSTGDPELSFTVPLMCPAAPKRVLACKQSISPAIKGFNDIMLWLNGCCYNPPAAIQRPVAFCFSTRVGRTMEPFLSRIVAGINMEFSFPDLNGVPTDTSSDPEYCS